jgi:mono/diheme cytochrome c family protein
MTRRKLLATLVGLALVLSRFAGGLFAQPVEVDGAALFEKVCANCHGKNGNGRGIASRYVFPRPRNLRGDSFRLVSTISGKPSAEDIYRTIEKGVPGTSMQSWEDLGKEKILALVGRVRTIRREGALERIQLELEEEGDIPPDRAGQLIEDYLQRVLVAGPSWTGLAAIPSDQSSILRGKAVYAKQKCGSCHGTDGRGSAGMDLVDQNGDPTWATDLVRGAFHGGADAQKIATRVFLGMPGSAMPSSSNLSEADLGALVAYCLSISAKPRAQLTNHQRRERAIGRFPVKNNSKSP